MFPYFLGNDYELRQLRLDHAAQLFALTKADRPHLRVWLPWVDRVYSPQDTKAFIQARSQQMTEGTGFAAILYHREAVAGVISIDQMNAENRSASIGYWLAAAHQGRGIMTAACRAIVQYGFEHLNLNRIVIAAATDNHRSRAIPERLGFVHEGTAREAEWLNGKFVDLEIYACLRRDWLSPPASAIATQSPPSMA